MADAALIARPTNNASCPCPKHSAKGKVTRQFGNSGATDTTSNQNSYLPPLPPPSHTHPPRHTPNNLRVSLPNTSMSLLFTRLRPTQSLSYLAEQDGNSPNTPAYSQYRSAYSHSTRTRQPIHSTCTRQPIHSTRQYSPAYSQYTPAYSQYTHTPAYSQYAHK